MLYFNRSPVKFIYTGIIIIVNHNNVIIHETLEEQYYAWPFGSAISNGSRCDSQASQSERVVLSDINTSNLKREKRVSLRQKSHGVNLPYTKPKSQQIRRNIDKLNHQDLILRPFRPEPVKDIVDVEYRLYWILKQHEDHHDAEDLKRVPTHVHPDRIHWERLCGRDGNFPRLLELQAVGIPIRRALGDFLF